MRVDYYLDGGKCECEVGLDALGEFAEIFFHNCQKLKVGLKKGPRERPLVVSYHKRSSVLRPWPVRPDRDAG